MRGAKESRASGFPGSDRSKSRVKSVLKDLQERWRLRHFRTLVFTQKPQKLCDATRWRDCCCCFGCCSSHRNPSIYNILQWVGWMMGQMNCRPRLWYSKYYFIFMISCKILCKNPFNLFSYFCFIKKITKIKIKSFECPKSIKKYKKIILGTSDSWSTIRLSHRPSNSA